MEEQLAKLQREIDQLRNSATIPRDVETAFRERLGTGAANSSSNVISGRCTLSAGKFDVTDPRISSTSVVLATVANTSGAGLANIAAGYLSGTTIRIYEGTFSATWIVNYIIIS